MTDWLSYSVKPAFKGVLSVPISNFVSRFTGGPMISEGAKVIGWNIPKTPLIFATGFAGALAWEGIRQTIPRYTTGNTTTSFLEEEAYATLVLGATQVAGLGLLRMKLSGINLKNVAVTAALTVVIGETAWGTIGTYVDLTPNYS